MAATSDVTTISPHRLAATFAGNGGLGLFAVPTPTTQVDIHQIWHLRFTRDPTHTWFRSCVQRAASALPPIARSVGTA
jgi:DNA-binding transcriptional LysR family regulator